MSLPTMFQEMIHTSRYARWDEKLGRRETWEETVDRYINFMCDVQLPGKIPAVTRQELRDAILNLEVMPSMRCMMTAGAALGKDNAAAFNCSAVSIDSVEAFDEMLYLLMVGSGVGFSVERQFIVKLPVIPSELRKSKTVIRVEDSRIGWANALRELMMMLYAGRIPEWDLSELRPAGAKLKTFGGRSSGPAPLESLFRFVVATFKNSSGKKLTSIDCHDICCKIAEVVVSGGQRRSATISMSNPSDDRMRYAKSGQWYDTAPWRAMANNSAVYTEKPDMTVWFKEWLALYESKSGERGIVNREAIRRHLMKLGRRNPDHDFIVNPCGEIALRPFQQCNLSEVLVRESDTEETLKRKLRLATIMGTMQASLTNFRYLRDIWKQNAEEEALLGVSLSGIMDNRLMAGKCGKTVLHPMLNRLRDYVIEVNKEWAPIIGVNPSTATTCVKPSGTVSSLAATAAGIHPRFSEYYIRTVRGSLTDPVTKLLMSEGVPYEPDVTRPEVQVVFSFPVKSPEGCVTVDDVNAIDQLELWKSYREHWCEHQPSITVYVKDSEWMEVGAWVYRHFDIVGGLSFLPKSDHCYQQAPYQEINQREYDAALAKMPKHINWMRMVEFEKDDSAVTSSKEYACTGGACELVDLSSAPSVAATT